MERVRPMQLLARSQRVSQSTLLLLNREHHAESTAAAIVSHTAQRRSNVYPGFSWYGRCLWLFQWYVLRSGSILFSCKMRAVILRASPCSMRFVRQNSLWVKHWKSCRGIIHRLSHSAAACAYPAGIQ